MTATGPLAFPGGRVLAGWARQLAPWQPGPLWVGHLLLHRIEALARCSVATPLDPLQAFLLNALALTPGNYWDALKINLHFDRHLFDRLVNVLGREQLVTVAGGLKVTDAGRQALAHGQYVQRVSARRVFYFVESEQPGRAPHFLGLADPPTRPWPTGNEWQFDVGRLTACVSQPAEWKQRFGFPLEVEKIVEGDADADEAEAWQHIILDRPERLTAVLALSTAGQRERLLGFAVQQDGWALTAEPPLFELGEGWPEVFPDLAAEPLQRGEVLKGESWMLAGDGRIRAVTALGLKERK